MSPGSLVLQSLLTCYGRLLWSIHAVSKKWLTQPYCSFRTLQPLCSSARGLVVSSSLKASKDCRPGNQLAQTRVVMWNPPKLIEKDWLFIHTSACPPIPKCVIQPPHQDVTTLRLGWAMFPLEGTLDHLRPHSDPCSRYK